MLEEQNKHPRDANITFDEGPHIYTINGNSDFTSVTTFCHALFKEFDAEGILDKIFSRKPVKEKYRDETRESLKAKWEKNRVEAADAGTLLHKNIEDFYNGETITNDSIEYGYFKAFHEKHAHLVPYRTEWMVYDEELKLAGSIDMVFENSDGSLSIYDWKRSKGIEKVNAFDECSTNEITSHIPDTNFWHYSLQLNVYKAILERNYGKCVNELYLICLHPNHKNYQKIRCADLSEEIKNLFEQRKLNI